tara:strand:- start:3414 stop:3755 length:342 start_codon:yes stop_codon:yes gene_type:complete
MHPLLNDALSTAVSPLEIWCLGHLSKQLKDMSPYQVWDIIAKIQNKNVRKKVCKKRKRKPETIDDLFSSETIHTCVECGGHDIINNQVQVRGADEPMTQFLYCQSCGAMWKED